MIYTTKVSIFDSIDVDDEIQIVQYIIGGVYLERSFGSSVNIDGEIKNYNATLIIPASYVSEDTYVEPKVWKKLSVDDKLKHFTLRSGQVIALLDEIVSYTSLDEILNSEDNVFRIIGVDCFDGVLPHFEIICK